MAVSSTPLESKVMDLGNVIFALETWFVVLQGRIEERGSTEIPAQKITEQIERLKIIKSELNQLDNNQLGETLSCIHISTTDPQNEIAAG